jgi:hypothetical protein
VLSCETRHVQVFWIVARSLITMSRKRLGRRARTSILVSGSSDNTPLQALSFLNEHVVNATTL